MKYKIFCGIVNFRTTIFTYGHVWAIVCHLVYRLLLLSNRIEMGKLLHVFKKQGIIFGSITGYKYWLVKDLLIIYKTVFYPDIYPKTIPYFLYLQLSIYDLTLFHTFGFVLNTKNVKKKTKKREVKVVHHVGCKNFLTSKNS